MMSPDSEKAMEGQEVVGDTKVVSETGSGHGDSHGSPLHRKLKSRHLQMIGKVFQCFWVIMTVA
jgi:amino acid permease